MVINHLLSGMIHQRGGLEQKKTHQQLGDINTLCKSTVAMGKYGKSSINASLHGKIINKLWIFPLIKLQKRKYDTIATWASLKIEYPWYPKIHMVKITISTYSRAPFWIMLFFPMFGPINFPTTSPQYSGWLKLSFLLVKSHLISMVPVHSWFPLVLFFNPPFLDKGYHQHLEDLRNPAVTSSPPGDPYHFLSPSDDSPSSKPPSSGSYIIS